MLKLIATTRPALTTRDRLRYLDDTLDAIFQLFVFSERTGHYSMSDRCSIAMDTKAVLRDEATGVRLSMVDLGISADEYVRALVELLNKQIDNPADALPTIVVGGRTVFAF